MKRICNPLTKKFDTILSMLSAEKGTGKKALSSLETKLFDSMEFCLALLGTVPIPLFIVNQAGKVIVMSAGRLASSSGDLICAHAADKSDWTIPEHPSDDCIFCSTVAKARKSAAKVSAKGEWHIGQQGSKEPLSLIVSIHAAPALIKDENYIIVALEDQTELERLKGLLPICMECNKIHDVENSKWIRIDQYVTDHSPARFSHGLCPECAEKLLKEIEH